MQLAGRGGDQHVVGHRQVLAAGEGLAEGGEGEGHGAADLLGEDGGAHGGEGVGGPGLGPAQRLEAALARPLLDLAHALVALVGPRPRVPAGVLPDAAEEDRLPDRDDGQHLVDALGGEVGVGGAEVVVEDRLVGHEGEASSGGLRRSGRACGRRRCRAVVTGDLRPPRSGVGGSWPSRRLFVGERAASRSSTSFFRCDRGDPQSERARALGAGTVVGGAAAVAFALAALLT